MNYPCEGCKHSRMYACTQGRSAYPNGNAVNCVHTKKKRGFEKDEDLWFEYLNNGLCGLCGNTGYVDTVEKAVSPVGVPCGVRRPCICPNGRAIKHHEQ